MARLMVGVKCRPIHRFVSGAIRFLLLLAAFPLAFELFLNILLRRPVGKSAVGVGSDFAEPHSNLLNILRRFKVHFFESIERGGRLFESMVELEQNGIDSRFHRFNLPSEKRFEAVKWGRSKHECDKT